MERIRPEGERRFTGEWILYNKRHTDELELQKFEFPDFSILESAQFKKVAAFNDFIFYEKVR